MADQREELWQMLLNGMSPDVNDRFGSGEALAQQFQLCLHPEARWL